MIKASRGVPPKILIFLMNNTNEINMYKLSGKINCVYSNMCLNVNKLESIGLIKTNKIRRNRYCELTEKGVEVAKLLKKLDKLCN